MSEHARSTDRDERLHAFSHDLKNRLGALWEAFLIARDLPAGPEREEVVAMAERSFFAGLRQVELLMDDMGVPRGPARVDRKALDLSTVVKRCVDHIGFLLDKKQQRVDLRLAGPVTISGDVHLLEQLFDALLSNAVKFSPRGTVLQVSVEQRNGEAVVQVKDPGVGLSPHDLERVFERYLILGSRSTDGERQARGTLTRARMWVTAHDGHLEAASPGVDKGCTFTVRLPLSA